MYILQYILKNVQFITSSQKNTPPEYKAVLFLMVVDLIDKVPQNFQA